MNLSEGGREGGRREERRKMPNLPNGSKGGFEPGLT